MNADFREGSVTSWATAVATETSRPARAATMSRARTDVMRQRSDVSFTTIGTEPAGLHPGRSVELSFRWTSTPTQDIYEANCTAPRLEWYCRPRHAAVGHDSRTGPYRERPAVR